MHTLLIVVIDGFFTGLVYGLFALGLVVVYQGSRVINFAHGEIGMIGTFAFVELWQNHLGLGLALVGGVGLSAGAAALTDYLVVRPLREQPRINSLVATFAVGALLAVVAVRRYGFHPKYTEPIMTGRGPRIGGLTILPIQLVMLAAVLSLVIGLIMLSRYTSFGLRLRATALDATAAGQVGINVAATSMATWAMAGGMAAICGILISSQVALTVGFMDPLLLEGLVAALIGGLTNPTSVFAVAVGLGIAEGLINYAFDVPGLVQVLLALGVIVLLLVRPAGLVKAEY